MKSDNHYRVPVWAFVTGLAVVATMFAGTSAFAAARKPTLATPIISCGDSTQASINVQVCAGPTGAPAGFSLQWETAAALALGPDGLPGTADDGQWYLSDDARLCKASFSGAANISNYNLGANQCVTVNVGDFLFDNGASTNCPDALVCGTDYVFRAFAHANSANNKSNFTADLTCGTLACDALPGCTLTQGYWKTHTPLVCNTDPGSPLCIEWPVTSLTLGTVSYSVSQLVSILNQPANGNGLIALAHQLIAAKLNIANGADPTDAAQAISDADALIGGLNVPPVGTWSCTKGICAGDYLKPVNTSLLTSALADYNEGATGPGHCE